MLRLLMITIILSSVLSAENIDDKVLAFEKKRVGANPRIKIENVSIYFKKEISLKDWVGYVFSIKATVQGKTINAKDIVFTNGDTIATDLFDMDSEDSLKSQMVPKLTNKYHHKKHLIAGTHNAKNKIVLFSDPLCPFCTQLVPEIIKHVKESPKNIALYYYHFPLLRIHPAAGILSKIMIVAKQKGIKDVELKIYETDFNKEFSPKQTDVKKILASANRVLGTNITEEELKNISFEEDIKMGDDAMVRGTPTIFINGVIDNTKLKYETLD